MDSDKNYDRFFIAQTLTILHKGPFWKWVCWYDSTAKGKTVSVIALGYLKIYCRRERERERDMVLKKWTERFILMAFSENHCPLLYWISFSFSAEAFICMGCVQYTLYAVQWCKNAREILREEIYLCDIGVNIKSNVKSILFIPNARTLKTLCRCVSARARAGVYLWKSNKKKRFLNRKMCE